MRSMGCKEHPRLRSGDGREPLRRGVPGTRISNIPTSHRRNSGAIQRSLAHTRRKREAKTFRGQSQRKRLLNREARLSKIGPGSHNKAQPSMSSRRHGHDSKAVRKAGERRRSQGTGKEKGKITRKVRNEVRIEIGKRASQALYLGEWALPCLPVSIVIGETRPHHAA